VKYLVAEHGFTSTLVCVDEYGMVTAAAVADALTPQTCLVSVMHSNNEVGTIMPIAEIAATLRAAREPGAPPILFHSDTSQSLGKVVVDVAALGVDYATITGHKLYAPKGIGALYAKPGNPPLRKLMVGAGHEGGRRAGTESTLLASGLGAACAVAKASLAEANGGDGEGEGSGVGGGATAKLAYLRDRLETRVIAGMGGAASGKVRVNGHPTLRLPNTCSLSFRGCLAPQLLRAVEHRVACSAGAACHTASMDGITNNDSGDDPRVSHVLRAMRVPLEYARGTLRLSVGRFTTEAEVDEAADLLVAAATKAFEQPI
jgi:cysteine desulfurase